jgi:hypothetical protein
MKSKMTTTDDFAAIEMVKVKAERAMNEAFEVLEGLKEGTISIAQATEMSNAIGKANGAMGNILKADLLALAIDKQAAAHVARLSDGVEK